MSAGRTPEERQFLDSIARFDDRPMTAQEGNLAIEQAIALCELPDRGPITPARLLARRLVGIRQDWNPS